MHAIDRSGFFAQQKRIQKDGETNNYYYWVDVRPHSSSLTLTIFHLCMTPSLSTPTNNTDSFWLYQSTGKKYRRDESKHIGWVVFRV